MVLASMSWLCTSSSASFFHYGKVPELFRNTSGTKTEKLKNCFFQRDPGRDSPYGFSFSVFQFPELFRNISGETEKLNFPGTCRQRFSIWIQFFSFSVFQIQEEILHMDSVFSSFSVFQFFSFRNYFGIFPEKLKN